MNAPQGGDEERRKRAHQAFLVAFAAVVTAVTPGTAAVACVERATVGATLTTACGDEAAVAAAPGEERRPPALAVAVGAASAFLVSVCAWCAYLSHASSSTPRSSVGQKRRPRERRAAAERQRGDTHAYQLSRGGGRQRQHSTAKER